MNYLRLLWLYVRLGALNELEYRANLAIQLVEALIGLGTALAGLAVVFAHTETLAGWRADELLALLGVYFLVGGLIGFVIQPSMQQLMEDVRLGTLDFTLTKPEDTQLLVSARQVRIWRLLDVLLGVGVLLTALLRLGAGVGVLQALAFGAALVAGGAIIYSFWLILATTSFWFVRVDNILVIFESMYQAGRWPVSIYPPWLRAALTFLVPVTFAVTVPSEALVGRLDAPTLASAAGLAAALLALSRWFWSVGVRRYAGASA
jgi:ABC-2 type transport system permease protein